jgi:hypothetical protein
MSLIQPILTPQQELEITAYINEYRTRNQAPPLAWDGSMYTFSQNWSSYLMSNNLFKHSGNQNYGENLAYFQGYGTDVMSLLKKSVDSWYNEISQYNFSSPGFTSATGHFTCLVWRSSTNFAIGIAINPTTQAATVTMNTYPAGNVQGEFETNVLSTVIVPPVPVPSPVPVPNPPVPTPVPLPVPSPVPVPVPLPVPIPTPVPNPPVPTPVPTPLPTDMNVNVISAIFNIIYMFERNQNRPAIIYAINNIITQYSQYMSQNTIVQLRNLIALFKSRASRMVIIRAINSILQSLK